MKYPLHILSLLLLSLWSISLPVSAEEVKSVVQTGHLSDVKYVDVSADGKYVVSSDGTSKVVLWNVATGRQIRAINLQGSFNSKESPIRVYFNSRSTAVILKDYFKTFAYDIQTGKCIAYWYNWIDGMKRANPKVRDLLVHRTPSSLYTKTKGKNIYLYDTASNQLLQSFTSNVDSVGRLVTHLYGQENAMINDRANPRYWWIDTKKPFLLDLKEGRVIKRLNTPNTRWSDMWRDLSGNIVIWDGRNAVYRYRFDNGAFMNRITLGGNGEVNHMAFLTDKRYVVYNRNKNLWVTSLATGKSLPIKLSEEADKSAIMGISALLTPHEYMVLRDSTYCPIRMRLGVQKEELLGNTRNKPKGFSVIGNKENLQLNLIRGEKYVSLLYNDNIFTQYLATNNTCASPFSENIAVGYPSGKVDIFDFNSTQRIQTLYPHSAYINDMVMHPYYEMVLTASDDGTIAIYNTDEERVKAYFTSVNNGKDYILRTPDNYYMASRYGTDAVNFVVGTDTYMFDQFDLKYNRPDIVLERIGLADQKQIDLLRNAYVKRLRRMNMTEEMLSTDFHVPTLTIDNVAELTRAQTVQQTLRVTPSDSRYKLRSVNVWINGVKVLTQTRPTKGRTMELPLTLAHGVNNIQVSCQNEKGVESYKQSVEVKIPETQQKNDLWIVCLGVSRYADSRFNLKYAGKDASDVAATLARVCTNDYMQIHSLTLTDADVTKAQLARVRQFLMQAKRDDSVILFYAGHGLLDKDYDYYLASYDTDFLNPSPKALPYEDFEMILDGIQPLKKLMLVDACYSGEIDKNDMAMVNTSAQSVAQGSIVFRTTGANVPKIIDASTEQINSLISENFSNLQRGTGATVISSAGGAEVSLEGAQWRNGLFTYCLLKGLSDKQADSDGDGNLSVAELQTYCQNKVTEMSNGVQQPTSRNENRLQPFILRRINAYTNDNRVR